MLLPFHAFYSVSIFFLWINGAIAQTKQTNYIILSNMVPEISENKAKGILFSQLIAIILFFFLHIYINLGFISFSLFQLLFYARRNLISEQGISLSKEKQNFMLMLPFSILFTSIIISKKVSSHFHSSNFISLSFHFQICYLT